MTEERGLGQGSVIADTYVLTRLLGEGGMGVVWEATHNRLPGKRVAIKVLHRELGRNAELLARFKREAEIASRLGHPNIVEVHDLGELANGAPYIVLEFLEGMTLGDLIERGPMALDTATTTLREVASGLSAAHGHGIVHRDLKPENVFLVSLGGEQQGLYKAKLLDFGISKIRGSTTVKTQESTMLGTPQYMAPEQAAGHHSDIDGRTDIFALGAMAYEMLIGEPAFMGQSIAEVVFKVVYEQPALPKSRRGDIPQAMEDAVMKALAKNRDERFGTVEEFIECFSGVPLGATASRSRISLAQSQASGPAKSHAPESMAKTMAPETAEEAASALPVEPPAAGERKNWIAIGVVFAALAAGALFLVATRSSEEPTAGLVDKTQPPRPTIAQEQTRPDVEVAPAAELKPASDSPKKTLFAAEADASIASPETKSGGLKTKDRVKVAPESDKPARNAGAALNTEDKKWIKDAERALKSKKYDEAKRLALRLVRNASTVSQGKLMLGKIACIEGDLGAVRGAQGRLSRSQRKELSRFCQSKKFPID